MKGKTIQPLLIGAAGMVFLIKFPEKVFKHRLIKKLACPPEKWYSAVRINFFITAVRLSSEQRFSVP